MTTHYESIGSAAALEDRRAGNSLAPLDEGAVLAHVGLDDGGREARAILSGEVAGYEGAEGVERASAEVLRGYRDEMAAV